jgi:hypothetical protein
MDIMGGLYKMEVYYMDITSSAKCDFHVTNQKGWYMVAHWDQKHVYFWNKKEEGEEMTQDCVWGVNAENGLLWNKFTERNVGWFEEENDEADEDTTTLWQVVGDNAKLEKCVRLSEDEMNELWEQDDVNGTPFPIDRTFFKNK